MAEKKADLEEKGLQELIRILEGAVDSGADLVDLEYEDGNFTVYLMFGNRGVGNRSFPKELCWPMVEVIQKRAGLARKMTGKMRVKLHGKDYEVRVKPYPNFDDSAYKLFLKEVKGP